MINDLEALKQTLKIPEVWQRLGLPGVPAKTCHSPFREDRTPSFSIYDQDRRWKDFATGESGDVIDFIACACSLELAEATRRFLTMAGDGRPASCVATPQASGSSLNLPVTSRGSVADLELVAQSRNISAGAVALARSLRTLTFGTVCGCRCWILFDLAHRIGEARRIDGKLFPRIGNLAERKAHTLRGSAKNWPAGVAVLESLPNFRAIMLVEGGPDYLAALHFCLTRDVHDVLPIAILGRGAGARLDDGALDLLRGRTVRIYPHNDTDGGGLISAEKWAAQLYQHGCSVDYYSLEGLFRRDGKSVKDLNDCVMVSPSDEPQLNELLP